MAVGGQQGRPVRGREGERGGEHDKEAAGTRDPTGTRSGESGSGPGLGTAIGVRRSPVIAQWVWGQGQVWRSEPGTDTAALRLQSNTGKAIVNPQLNSNSQGKGGAGPHFQFSLQ